jgi:HEXXH motif-containing protein
VWTARGDAFFPAGALGPARPGTPDPKRRAWRAPAVDRGPAIDGLSPYCTFEGPRSVASTAGHSPPELALVVRRVGDAMRRTASVNAEVIDTVRMFTTVVVCRKSADRRPGFASMSWPALAGKTALLDAHDPRLGVERIAQALVHEAIHSVLFATEACEAFAVDSPELDRATAVSPWSRRQLPIRNYLHACFVWYGLWCFWTLAREGRAFAPAPAATLLARAELGFRGPSLLAPLTPLRRYLAPAVLDGIAESQETVVNSLGCR